MSSLQPLSSSPVMSPRPPGAPPKVTLGNPPEPSGQVDMGCKGKRGGGAVVVSPGPVQTGLEGAFVSAGARRVSLRPLPQVETPPPSMQQLDHTMLIARTGLTSAAFFGLLSPGLEARVKPGGVLKDLTPLVAPRPLGLEDLNIQPWSTSVLAFASGVSSLPAELGALGFDVLAVDPCYADSPYDLAHQGELELGQVATKLTQVMDARPQSVHPAFREVFQSGAETRMKERSLDWFLRDYMSHRERYVPGALPRVTGLPHHTLGLMGHFLFLYDHLPGLGLQAHLQMLRNALQLVDELRVYPVVSLDGQPSRYLSAVMETLQEEGWRVRLVPVPYANLAGATRMMVVDRG